MYFQRWHFYCEITCFFLKYCFNFLSVFPNSSKSTQTNFEFSNAVPSLKKIYPSIHYFNIAKIHQGFSTISDLFLFWRKPGWEKLEGGNNWKETHFVNGSSEGMKDGGFAVSPQESHSLCLPDLFQTLVTEASHNAFGCAGLQCHSCAGGPQTEIQPFNLAGSWPINMVEDWGLSPNPASKTKGQLKDLNPGPKCLPHREGKQPHAVILTILFNSHISKYPIRLHSNKQKQNENVEILQISRCALNFWKLDHLD